MSGDFEVLDHHLEQPRATRRDGMVVLSRIPSGRSSIGSGASSVKIILEGEATYTVDGRTVRVRPGQFLYLDEGGCELSSRSDIVGLCVLLPHGADAGAGIGLADDGPRGDDPVFGRALVLSSRGSGIGRTLDDYSRAIVRDPSAGYRLAAHLIGKMNDGLAAALGETQAAMRGLSVVKPSTRIALFERLERARAHLHMNDDRAISLPELAALSGLSRFHLARFFKLAFGTAPIAYHRALRLERACALLAEGHRPLTEIAMLTGYSDEVALSHAFRRQFGRPPQMWAMQQRQANTVNRSRLQ